MTSYASRNVSLAAREVLVARKRHHVGAEREGRRVLTGLVLGLGRDEEEPVEPDPRRVAPLARGPRERLLRRAQASLFGTDRSQVDLRQLEEQAAAPEVPGQRRVLREALVQQLEELGARGGVRLVLLARVDQRAFELRATHEARRRHVRGPRHRRRAYQGGARREVGTERREIRLTTRRGAQHQHGGHQVTRPRHQREDSAWLHVSFDARAGAAGLR